jgi:phosphoribosylamine---glycine ligase
MFVQLKRPDRSAAARLSSVDRIQWPDGFCRRDIGWQAVEREKAGG